MLTLKERKEKVEKAGIDPAATVSRASPTALMLVAQTTFPNILSFSSPLSSLSLLFLSTSDIIRIDSNYLRCVFFLFFFFEILSDVNQAVPNHIADDG